MGITNPKRCGAKSKSRGGAPCLQLALANGRCYYHGGKSTGPRTAQGRLRCKEVNVKHGLFTAEAIAERRAFNDILKEHRKALRVL